MVERRRRGPGPPRTGALRLLRVLCLCPRLQCGWLAPRGGWRLDQQEGGECSAGATGRRGGGRAPGAAVARSWEAGVSQAVTGALNSMHRRAPPQPVHHYPMPHVLCADTPRSPPACRMQCWRQWPHAGAGSRSECTQCGSGQGVAGTCTGNKCWGRIGSPKPSTLAPTCQLHFISACHSQTASHLAVRGRAVGSAPKSAADAPKSQAGRVQ